MSNKTVLPADEYGEALHTALRKCCDSTPTTYAWNVIHLVPISWAEFCEAAAEASARTGPELKAVWEAFDLTSVVQSTRADSFYAAQIFRISLDDFDDDDWDGFAAYLDQ